MNTNVQTWILLRGLTREQRHWGRFPDKLQSSFPDSKILTPDLSGNGRNCHQRSPATVIQMLLQLRKDIAPQLEAGPVHILALSMGAMVAMEWLRRFPDDCEAAVLINSSFKGVCPLYYRLRPENYLKILRGLFSPSLKTREEIILSLTSHLAADRDSLIDQWISYARTSPVSRLSAVNQLIAASRYRLPAEKPASPIYLLRSQNDQLVNSQCSVDLANQWSLPIDTHPTAGHDLPLDDEDWVCQKITRWLDAPNVS